MIPAEQEALDQADMLLAVIKASGVLSANLRDAPAHLEVTGRLGGAIVTLCLAADKRLLSLNTGGADRALCAIRGVGGAIGVLMSKLSPEERMNLLDHITMAAYSYLQFSDPPERARAWQAYMDAQAAEGSASL